jgi:hypothetical protein
MSGIKVIRYKLANNAALLAVVPAARIVAGDLDLNTTLPVISIRQISSIRRNTVSMAEAKTFVTERVQVSVLVKSYEQGGADYAGLENVLKLVRQACPNSRGTVNGVELDSILPLDEGPDLPSDTAEILQRSMDFRVTWTEAR